MNRNIGVILLAGGYGSRMGMDTPKQYLELQGKPLIRHSLDFFLALPMVSEVVIVCDSDYRGLFTDDKVTFASPGKRRQDSVFNGLQMLSPETALVCIHDSARPFVEMEMVQRVLDAGKTVGAAAVGVPMKPTVKRCNAEGFVEETLDRSTLWEVQTPQVLTTSLLHEGFAYVNSRGLTVTDDVALAELLHHPVRMVFGSYANIKVTTLEDLQFAEHHLSVVL